MPPGVSPEMEVLTKAEVQVRYDEIVQKIREGAIFIHPSDTIYGLGCNALNLKAVAKIRKLKQRQETPFSIWVPSLQWITDHCVVDKITEQWIQKLPGPYTLILPIKKKGVLAENVIPGLKAVGIRYPNHWFRKVVTEAGVPMVTTSANKTGKPFMTSIDDLDPEIEQGVEFMIYEGSKEARPSKIINLVEGVVKER